MKTGCVVAGQIRSGFDEVLNGLCWLFDCVIVSTWKGSEEFIPKGDFELLLNDPPPNGGISNRNFQRVATQAGIRRVESLGCDYVLKWRPDMLPTEFSLDEVVDWAHYKVPRGFPSRIIMSPFRNLSIIPDWFSSFPDMYAFGHIEMIKLLWLEGDFDFTKDFNLPAGLLADKEFNFRSDNKIYYKGRDITEHYSCHLEHYGFFKDALQNRLRRKIRHREICRDFLYLANHERWKILYWRGLGSKRFRSFRQMTYVPWITESVWRKDKLPEPISLDAFLSHRNVSLVGRFLNTFRVVRETVLQHRWHNAYGRRMGLPRVKHEALFTPRKILSGFRSLFE